MRKSENIQLVDRPHWPLEEEEKSKGTFKSNEMVHTTTLQDRKVGLENFPQEVRGYLFQFCNFSALCLLGMTSKKIHDLIVEYQKKQADQVFDAIRNSKSEVSQIFLKNVDYINLSRRMLNNEDFMALSLYCKRMTHLNLANSKLEIKDIFERQSYSYTLTNLNLRACEFTKDQLIDLIYLFPKLHSIDLSEIEHQVDLRVSRRIILPTDLKFLNLENTKIEKVELFEITAKHTDVIIEGPSKRQLFYARNCCPIWAIFACILIIVCIVGAVTLVVLFATNKPNASMERG